MNTQIYDIPGKIECVCESKDLRYTIRPGETLNVIYEFKIEGGEAEVVENIRYNYSLLGDGQGIMEIYVNGRRGAFSRITESRSIYGITTSLRLKKGEYVIKNVFWINASKPEAYWSIEFPSQPKLTVRSGIIILLISDITRLGMGVVAAAILSLAALIILTIAISKHAKKGRGRGTMFTVLVNSA